MSSLPFPAVPRAAILAARFLRPPGRCKRAELREKPRRKTGKFENLVKSAVRLREKAKEFADIPPPRLIPVAQPIRHKFLQPIESVPKITSLSVQRRLSFLLSSSAVEQQKSEKINIGYTPYQTELFMWERQMRDLRRIYRAQFLQRLAEVTEEERRKQFQLYIQERDDRRSRREETLQRVYDDKKRRAVLKDRMQIERKVTQSIQLGRVSRKKIANLLWLDKIQKSSHFLQNHDEYMPAVDDDDDEYKKKKKIEEAEAKIFRNINIMNVSAPDILTSLGMNEKEASLKKRIFGTDDVFQEIMEESFSILPEDAPSTIDTIDDVQSKLTHQQKAVLSYAGFSDEEKLKLIDEKILMLNNKIDAEASMRGTSKQLLLLQLKDNLEAAKHAYLEKDYILKTEEKLKEQK